MQQRMGGHLAAADVSHGVREVPEFLDIEAEHVGGSEGGVAAPHVHLAT